MSTWKHGTREALRFRYISGKNMTVLVLDEVRVCFGDLVYAIVPRGIGTVIKRLAHGTNYSLHDRHLEAYRGHTATWMRHSNAGGARRSIVKPNLTKVDEEARDQHRGQTVLCQL